MNSVDKAISKSIEYILSHREKNGMWLNFLTRTHGESADWVSSYIGLSLINAGVDESVLSRTAEAISRRQRENGGFSYNDKIVPDADSTAFAIMFLSNFGYGKEIKKAKKFLQTHQNLDGSFSTYRPELIRTYFRISKDTSVDGWCSGTVDITANVLQALGYNENSLNFILESQQKEGFWRAYWWNEDVYSTVHSIFAIKDFDFKDKLVKGQEWLARRISEISTPFYSALSLQGLMTNGRFNGEIESGIKNLLDSQQEDGSWKTYPILRFPHPSNTEPWIDSNMWREDARDQNRLFTTATCLKTLSDYRRRSNRWMEGNCN